MNVPIGSFNVLGHLPSRDARRCRPVSAAVTAALGVALVAGVAGGAGVSGHHLAQSSLSLQPGLVAAARQSPGSGAGPAVPVGANVDASDAATRVLVPVVGYEGDDDRCSARLAVQNLGSEPCKAVMLEWGKPEGSPTCGDGGGPLAVECTGLIRPGGTWNLQGDQVAPDTKSAVLYSFATRRVSETGASAAPDQVVADWFCRRLGRPTATADTGLASCAEYAAFSAAFSSGGEFEGIPMDAARGGPLAVTVRRDCRSDREAEARVTGAYQGVGANALGSATEAGAYQYFAAPIGLANAVGIVYLQNAGLDTASVELWQTADGGGELCGTVRVSPGSSATFRPEQCGSAPWQGGLGLVSTQPIAAAVDLAGYGALATFVAVPAGAVSDATGVEWPPGARDAAFGPLVYDSRYGWETEVAVQNLSAARNGDVVVEFHDTNGDLLTSFRRTVPPFGVRSVELPPTSAQPWTRVGSVRVVSSLPAADPAGGPVPVSAVAVLTRYSDPERSELLERAAYNLTPTAATLDAQSRRPAAQREGASVVSLPWVPKDLDGVGVTSEIVLANQVPDPGWTDVAVLVYDQNALVDVLCRRLDALEVAYLDLQILGAVDNGLIGSAVVSATYWEHAAPAGNGTPAANRVGIDAAVIYRDRTRLGEDVTGDETAVAEGLPLRLLPDDIRAGVGRPCDPAPSAPPVPTAMPGPVPAAMAGTTYLPVMTNVRLDDVCETQLFMVNAGTAAAKGVVILWGEPGSCPPTARGPATALCTGLLAPGGDWTLSADALGPGRYSGVVLSFNTLTLGELGVEPGSPVPAIDRICDGLAARLAGDAYEAAELRDAYDRGLAYQGLPLGPMTGGPIEVTVERACPDVLTAGVKNVSRYGGVAARSAHAVVPPTAVYQYTAAARAGVSAQWTALYAQNVGLECADLTLSSRDAGNCLYEGEATIASLAPGEAIGIDPEEFEGPGFSGAFTFRSTQPLAVAVDDLAPGSQRTHAVPAGSSPADVNGDGGVDASDLAAFEAARGSVPADGNWNARADTNRSDTVDDTDLAILSEFLCGRERDAIPGPPATAGRRADFVMLPAIQSGALGVTCPAQLTLQNVGDVGAKAALVSWAAAGSAPGTCDAPSGVSCTGLLRPGGTWVFDLATDVGRSLSGVLFSFRAATLGELGLVPGSDVLAADQACAALQTVVGNCDGYAAFKTAFDSGAAFAGLPMAAVGGPGLAADLVRDCGVPVAPAAYEGIGANSLGSLDPNRDGFAYHVPLVIADRAGFDTTLHIQNAGSTPTSATLRLADQVYCASERALGTWALDPGESANVPVADLVRGWQGAARVTASGPLAVVADMVGRGAMAAYRAVPSRTDVDAAGHPVLASDATVLYGPLSYDPQDAWDIGVQVYNLDYRHPARVHVEFRDDTGAVVESLEDGICAAGAQTFFLPVVNALGEGGVGSVWVESVRTPADPAVPPAPIDGLVTLYRYSDPMRTELLAAAAYNMVPAPQALGWRGDADGGLGGLRNGVGVVALPGVGFRPERAGTTTQIAVTDLVLADGWTDAAVLFFDQNGLVDVACRRITAGHAVAIDLAATDLPAGFRGAAVVSAAVWHHPVLDAVTGDTRNLVGLAAAWAFGKLAGASEPPNDQTEVSVGMPLRQLPWPAGMAIGDLCGVGPTPAVTPSPGPSPTPTGTGTATSIVPPTPSATTALPPGGPLWLPVARKGR